MEKLPRVISVILSQLKKQGFEAYAVGGCVRDLLLSQKPRDWDITTNAKPEEIQKIFPDSFYQNKFGTVTVKTKSKDPTLKEIEITTFRTEQKYTDKRHPDKIGFASTLAEDLSRRDFTINALALTPQPTANNQQPAYKIIDLFSGQRDLKEKVVRAVGEPSDRFNEDALRLLRAVRIAAELNFEIEPQTLKAVKENAAGLRFISQERLRDELVKMIMSERASEAIELLNQSGLLRYVIPELEKGIDISQNRHHIYTIYQHSVMTLKFAAERNYNLGVRLASLFHDIAKPQTKRGQGPDATFYNHDIVGAKFTARILERLRFPKKIIEKTALLVRHHMFVYNVDEVSAAGVRRLLRRVGPENIQDLLNLRIADRLGSGCPKAVPYKLRHLQYLIDRVSREPLSPKMLKINGNEVMKILGLQPGQRVGLILEALLAQVLENPKLNTKKNLKKITLELNQLSDNKLTQKGKIVEDKKEEVDLEIKKKYWVK